MTFFKSCTMYHVSTIYQQFSVKLKTLEIAEFIPSDKRGIASLRSQ